MSSTFQTYDLTLSANQAQRLAVNGNYFLILTQTGKITLRGNFGIFQGLGLGQGMKGQEFKELQIQDVSGAPNSVTILVGMSDSDAEFINLQTIVATASLDAASLLTMRTPLLSTGSYSSATAMAANTPDTIFTPAANVNGAIVLYGSMFSGNGSGPAACGFVAKTSAPAGFTDGEAVLHARFVAANLHVGDLQVAQRIAAGKGLYAIAATAESFGSRACRYYLL